MSQNLHEDDDELQKVATTYVREAVGQHLEIHMKNHGHGEHRRPFRFDAFLFFDDNLLFVYFVLFQFSIVMFTFMQRSIDWMYAIYIGSENG